MVNWNAPEGDIRLAGQVANRAVKVWREMGRELDYQQISLDLVACHANGCPMDFAAMLAAGESDFVHDIAGIQRHIDRETGQLRDCFLPRFAAA